MRARLARLQRVVREAARIFRARGARFLAAAVAFYTLLAAAPMCLVILTALGAVLGHERAEGALWDALGAWIAPEGLETAQALTAHLEQLEAREGVLGGVLLIYGSTRLFRALRRALNELWGIELEHVESARRTAHKYGVRYGGALGLVALATLNVALLAGVKTLIAFVPVTQLVWALDFLASVLLAFALFAAVFRFVPETEVTWRDALASAAVTTVLFALGSSLVTLYVHRAHTSALYEGIGAVVVAMLWVYYSAQVFFFGACVGAVLHASEREGRSGAAAADPPGRRLQTK
ncbi:MAG: YihY/virulence factor BrkB family protein [Sandaracinus sp.]